ncbi:M23 family metallopeptidase [Tabrizicola sp.]|uniref:M23 family metallopeptidase n=1 Tax=Tabrizicola sp. TaxID=2005166 RepID=UPI003F40EF60
MIRTTASLSLALALPAGAFELQQPVDCTLGETCYIQQYFDHDPGPAAADFTCGPLSYDGHDGTDFALATRAEMAAGITVLAAAPGTVKGARDGIADFAPAVEGRECGNGIVIDHGKGWETQYCHLKQGSVLVKPGDIVQAGTPLGLIGQSGAAAFPHLHLSVRQNGVKLDPFSIGTTACGSTGDDLWSEDLPAEPGGLLDIGITTAVPEYDAIKAGLLSPDLPTTAPALVVWAYYFGPKAGDEIALSITGPEGEVIAQRLPIEKTQALAFRAIGQKLKTEGWPPGAYEGTATLFRAGQQIDRMQVSITVEP